jgi:hypothetical protein
MGSAPTGGSGGGFGSAAEVPRQPTRYPELDVATGDHAPADGIAAADTDGDETGHRADPVQPDTTLDADATLNADADVYENDADPDADTDAADVDVDAHADAGEDDADPDADNDADVDADVYENDADPDADADAGDADVDADAGEEARVADGADVGGVDAGRVDAGRVDGGRVDPVEATGPARRFPQPVGPPSWPAVPPESSAVADLVAEYGRIRADWPSGPRRTSMLTELCGRLIVETAADPSFEPAIAMASADPGWRLAGYAAGYGRPRAALLAPLTVASTVESVAFNRYWAVRAVGRVIDRWDPRSPVPPELVRQLADLRGRVGPDSDEWFELDAILAGLPHPATPPHAGGGPADGNGPYRGS